MQPHKNEKGIALLMAMFTVVIITYLAAEISYEVGIEYRLSKNEYDDLKARYAAKSAMEISLLRVSMYKQVFDQFGGNISDPAMLDMIWQFPFSWPPAAPEDASLVAKEEISGILEETTQDTAWTSIIESEGNRIDINDLYSPSKVLAEATQEKILQLLVRRQEADDEWAQANRSIDMKEIVNNIVDWIDPDEESPHAGSEGSLYGEITEVTLPPNADLKTIEELHMVAGVTDDIYNIIAPVVTVYGIKGINVNYADKQQLMAIDTQILEEVADAILTRRNDPDLGPFKDLGEFQGFLEEEGLDIEEFNKTQMPLRFGKEFNFRIKAIGMFGQSQRQIEAIVYDFTNAKLQLNTLIDAQAKAENESNQQNNKAKSNNNNTNNNNNSSNQNSRKNSNQPTFDKGKPKVIYWKES